MKPTLLFTGLGMILSTAPLLAKSELETLRSRCAEQERQIRQLEDENSRLRSDSRESRSTKAVSSTSAKAQTAVPPTETVSATTSTYVVKSGDSLEKIARKVGTSVQNLIKSNGLKSSSIIHPGQKLKVPGSVARTSAPVAKSTPAAQNSLGKSYTIRQGDTYSSISRSHGISTNALIAANPNVKPTAMRPGMVIKLGGSAPASTTTISAPISRTKSTAAPAAKAQEMKATTSSEMASPAPTQDSPPAVEKEAPSAPAKKFHAVTIDGEMTYGDFAAKHGTDAERLNSLNGLDLTTATVLAKGSELYVPAQP